jgi:hypothetical protein
MRDIIILEEFCLLGYIAVQFVEIQLMVRRNLSTPYAWSMNKARKKPAVLAPCFMLVSFFAYSSL